MNIVRCDICNKEMRFKPFECDSETQYYTLINKYGGRELETDICNECMHKLIDFVKAPSVITDSIVDIVRCEDCTDYDTCDFEFIKSRNGYCNFGERIEE